MSQQERHDKEPPSLLKRPEVPSTDLAMLRMQPVTDNGDVTMCGRNILELIIKHVQTLSFSEREREREREREGEREERKMNVNFLTCNEFETMDRASLIIELSVFNIDTKQRVPKS